MANNGLLQARCEPDFSALVDRAAQARGMSHAAYLRNAARTALALDGFELATEAPRDAGSLYNLNSEGFHWALVVDGAVKAMHRSHTKPTAADALPHVGEWLQIDYEDALPFDPALHWRLAPVLSIETDRVVRTFPVIEQEGF